MTFNVGKGLADYLEHVDFSAWCKFNTGQTVVQADLQVGAAPEVLYCFVDRGWKTATVNAQAEGCQKFPELAVGFVQSIA
jgi:hypothetical protein